jgi:hypothetical protein
MFGFGLARALLALLSVRLTDRPQRWASVHAAYMVLVGAGLLFSAPSADTMTLLGWVWPPRLLALVVWMFVPARKYLRSRTRVWLLYRVRLPLQEGMFSLSTDSVHRVLPDATHASLIAAESDAAVASQAILNAVESVRTGTPLADP